MYIEVKREDYPERAYRFRGKIIKIIPKHSDCRYICEGKEIAFYDGILDVLYLKTALISKDRSLTDYERALSGSHAEAYRYLFDMLGVDEKSRLSEYMNI